MSSNLFVRGTLPSGGVAIVGSRTPPPAAAAFAYELAFRIGEPVIAGLALGVDAAAHRGALDAGVPTIAFVGYGFGRTYPPENAELEAEILRGGGAIATRVSSWTPVTDEALIGRDRLQAEHARAVVLVCSEIDGGAMHTMAFARKLGRPRYAVAPPVGAQSLPQWAGNVACIAGGATPLPFDVDAALVRLKG
ncbi:MAG: DNA-processing protein DprA [Candidatus Eremiobacteraeota bacterium]|nr:DNA-processing protein DprA [Candidatus Eremiobacteraeota bacterium]